MGRIINAQLYVAGVTSVLQVLGWTGTVIFSVARLFHLVEKLEQLGLIRDVSFHPLLAIRWRKVPLDVVFSQQIVCCLIERQRRTATRARDSHM